MRTSSAATSMRRTRPIAACTAALLFAVHAQAACAADADTVDIGGERKPAHAIVRGMVAGDTGCYLTLDDGRGNESEQLAVFEICEREAELVGKRVKLGYALENVMAAECQGDPECGKSEQVAVVSKATVVQQ